MRERELSLPQSSRIPWKGSQDKARIFWEIAGCLCLSDNLGDIWNDLLMIAEREGWEIPEDNEGMPDYDAIKALEAAECKQNSNRAV